jgi:hypothetical protein
MPGRIENQHAPAARMQRLRQQREACRAGPPAMQYQRRGSTAGPFVQRDGFGVDGDAVRLRIRQQRRILGSQRMPEGAQEQAKGKACGDARGNLLCQPEEAAQRRQLPRADMGQAWRRLAQLCDSLAMAR